jgi:putative tryptophan/tyrosine transport system substrate-binding protein
LDYEKPVSTGAQAKILIGSFLPFSTVSVNRVISDAGSDFRFPSNSDRFAASRPLLRLARPADWGVIFFPRIATGMIPLGTWRMAIGIGRRQFIFALGGTAVAWPLAARAQQPTLPVVGLINGSSPDAAARNASAFRKGLDETGYVEGQNVTVEYHWLEGHYDRLPALMGDLVRRQVAVIATPGSTPAMLAAKAATTTIPIVFGAGEDPVKLGLVASLARPGGNATGINYFVGEVVNKRLRLLHDLLPKAIRIAVLVNPANSLAESTLRDLQQAAPALGLQIQILNATTIGEIDAAFATFVRERPDALFVAPDGFFSSRRVQLATLTAVNRIPATYSNRDAVAAGGLMSYGTDVADMFHQVGVYTGRILKGAKPADLPVLQSTKFEFVLNLQTARALGIEVPPGLLSIADEVIE